MSAQDNIEKTLKQIHIMLSEGDPVPGNPDKVIVSKKQVLAILEQLNQNIYDIMDQYEATRQSRELAQRRSEKKGEEMMERISRQSEDVYAASLLYTDDALRKVQRMMDDAMRASRKIWTQLNQEFEKEQRRVKEDHMELREQLQDFRDSNKYLFMIEERNREREKEENAPEKRIQNEAKHYPMHSAPEIKANPSYSSKRRPDLLSLSTERKEESDLPRMPRGLASHLEGDGESAFPAPEIRVDLDAEYFKWREEAKGKQGATGAKGANKANGNTKAGSAEKNAPAAKKERKFTFGKK